LVNFAKSITYQNNSFLTPKSKIKRAIRIISKGFIRLVAAFLALTFAVMILLNIPAVQTFITQKIGNTLSEQTGAGVSVGRVNLVLTGYLGLRDVLITTPALDTIVYAGRININVNMLKALRKEINITNVNLEHFKTTVKRDRAGRFNFDFIVEALAADEAEEKTANAAAPFDWEISIGNINLSEFNISYRDEIAGLDAGIMLGQLVIEPEKIDLQNTGVFIDEIGLGQTSVRLKMWETEEVFIQEESEKNMTEPEAQTLPEIGINLMEIHDFNFNFDDLTAGTKAMAGLEKFIFKPGQINLNTKNLHLGTLDISGFTAQAEVFSDTTSALPDTAAPATGLPQNLQLNEIASGWNIVMKRMAIENSSLQFNDRSFEPTGFGLDANHFLLDNMTLIVEDIDLNESRAGLRLSEFSFAEQSGFSLQKMAFKTAVSEKEFTLSELEMISPKGNISGGVKVTYASLSELIGHPEKAAIQLNFAPSIINTDEIFTLSGINPQDTLTAQYSNLQVGFEIAAQGLADSIHISKLNFSLPESTTLESSGTFSYLVTNPEKPAVDFTIQKFETTAGDIIALSDSSYFENIRLPEFASLYFNVSGTPNDATFLMQLETENGRLETGGFYNSTRPEIKDRFGADIKLTDLQAGYFLQDTTIGNVNMTANFSGERSHQDSVTADFSIDQIMAEYLGYNYRDLKISGAINKSDVNLSVTSGDENLDFTLLASAKMDPAKTTFDAELAVEMLNLYNLSLLEEKIALRTNIKADGFYGGNEHLAANIKIAKTEIISENDAIATGEVLIQPEVSAAGTALTLKSQMVNLLFDSNMLPDEMAGVMRLAMDRYMGKSDTVPLPAGKEMNVAATLNLPDTFRERFLPDLKQFVTDTLSIRYQSDQNNLKATFGVPVAAYQNAVLQNFDLSIDAAGDSLHLVTGFDSLIFDTLQIPRLHVEQFFNDGNIRSAITLGEENGSGFYRFLNRIIISEDATTIAFPENGLTLNGQIWHVNPNNRLVISNSLLMADDFEFLLDSSRIALQTSDSLQQMSIQDFPVANISAIVATPSGKKLAGGLLNAEVSLPVYDPYSGISANISIAQLELLGAPIGNLNFELAETTDHLELLLTAQTAFNSVNAKGKIGKSTSPQPIDFSIDLKVEDPSKFEVFTLDNLSEMAGEISGNIQISGYTDAPELDGFLHFEQATMRLNALNMKLQMPDEKLVFNSREIVFDDFDLLDENKTPLTLEGKVNIFDLNNPSFDLKLNTSGFQPINSTAANNDLFYGSLMIDMAVDVRGDAELPVVDAGITIRNGTDLTYVLPGSEIELVSSEGIVNFVNPYNEIDSIFNPEIEDYITDSVISRVSGIDMSLNFRLDPLAKFTVLIDPNSGDYATLSGSANLNVVVDPGGGQTITGIFEVTEGIYSLSFYGLVKRVFTFEPGSSIAWSGDPFAANMNFTAKHTVRTQSLALVANETSGMTDAERNMFRQRLPYEVLLNIKGFLTEPEIGFRIELPEKYLINYPQVAGKLNLLNSGQIDSELNKQVFALLVTGSFIADNPFASTGGSAENFVTTAARNSVNGILAEQLNRVSNRYIKNVDVNFGLTSYEDFSGDGSQTRTELDVQVSKKLLNDRLTIEASGTFDVEGNRQYSSTATGHTYGEFSATYDITENGEYRLRLYRENAYDLFDGEVAYSGIAFIIQKSFNALFQRTPKSEKPAAIIDDDDFKLDEDRGME
jgi:translocation and assembly module TamB